MSKKNVLFSITSTDPVTIASAAAGCRGVVFGGDIASTPLGSGQAMSSKILPQQNRKDRNLRLRAETTTSKEGRLAPKKLQFYLFWDNLGSLLTLGLIVLLGTCREYK